MSVLDEALRRGELAAEERYITPPEGAPLRFRLAGRGDRAGALAIDLCFIIGGYVCLLILFGAIEKAFTQGGFRLPFATVLGQLLFFIIRWGYFIAFELTPRAATPGKRILKIRVVSRDGRPLTPESIIVRNLMRDVEIFIPVLTLLTLGGDGWSGIFVAGVFCCLCVLPWCNRDRMRGGDFLAGTWVVKTPKPVLASDQTEAKPGLASRDFLFTPAQLDVYGEYELQVLEGVLRDDKQGRHELIREVAENVARKIGWTEEIRVGAREDFLNAFYTAQRAHLEARRLAGKIRKDKTDVG